LQTALDELYVKGNAKAAGKFYSENYTAHAGSKTYRGRKFILKYATSLRKTISGIIVLKTGLLSDNGNRICWRRTLSGMHRASFRGIPASGKKVK